MYVEKARSHRHSGCKNKDHQFLSAISEKCWKFLLNIQLEW
jgi:hypothetical protein